MSFVECRIEKIQAVAREAVIVRVNAFEFVELYVEVSAHDQVTTFFVCFDLTEECQVVSKELLSFIQVKVSCGTVIAHDKNSKTENLKFLDFKSVL